MKLKKRRPPPKEQRRFSAQEVAAGQVLAHAAKRYALRRILNACEPNLDGSFSFAKGSEPAKFLSNTIIRRVREGRTGPWYVLRVECQPEPYVVVCKSFDEAVACATPFEAIFPIRIVAC